MALSVDRLKSSLFALVRAAIPRWVYAAPRIARVVKATTTGDGTTLDVVPDDPAFPSMSGVPLFHGLPGVTLTLVTGTQVLVEFSEADPARPFVRSWAGGEHVAEIAIAGDMVTVGGLGLDDPPVKLTPLSTYLKAVATHVHTGVTTGAASSGTSPTLAVVPPDEVLGATSVKVK